MNHDYSPSPLSVLLSLLSGVALAGILWAVSNGDQSVTKECVTVALPGDPPGITRMRCKENRQ
jgi:hypothetical protein